MSEHVWTNEFVQEILNERNALRAEVTELKSIIGKAISLLTDKNTDGETIYRTLPEEIDDAVKVLEEGLQ